MQQTEKYQFNLIERSDLFLPEPLNENMERVDAALAEKDAALADRARFVSGSYIGTGTYGLSNPITLELPDAEHPPRVIFVSNDNGALRVILIRGMPRAATFTYNNNWYYIELTWTDKGVSWYCKDNAAYHLNNKDQYYYYAILV